MYAFESVTMIFKLALWACLVFFPQGSELQLATALLLNIINLLLLAYFYPYKNPFYNGLQVGVLIITTGVNFYGLIVNHLVLSR